MATFVIVHGGWGGGWEWAPVARKLRASGHEVYTPTLTGMGERSHLATGDIGLDVHIEDVLAVLTFEQLDDVILCGHSYGGMVVTGVADRAPERIRLLTYLDGLVPRDGQSAIDTIPEEFSPIIMGPEESRRDGMVPYPAELQPPEGFIDEATRSAYVARMRPQPAATFTEPIRLTGAVDNVPRAFVHCTVQGELLAPFAQRARDEGWLYREIDTEHDLHLLDPAGTVAILDELAQVAPESTPV